MNGAPQVPCLHPEQHGVRYHVPGSEAARRCQAGTSSAPSASVQVAPVVLSRTSSADAVYPTDSWQDYLKDGEDPGDFSLVDTPEDWLWRMDEGDRSCLSISRRHDGTVRIVRAVFLPDPVLPDAERRVADCYPGIEVQREIETGDDGYSAMMMTYHVDGTISEAERFDRVAYRGSRRLIQ